jgi:CRISPR-associated protein Cst2
MSQPLYSLSISGRITLDMHSLNNEGGEGNQTLTRQVTIVAPDENGKPRLAAVNAISGDMMKHIQAEHLHRICMSDLTNHPLCQGCRSFSANRINDDPAFFTELGNEKGTAAILDKLLPHCTMDDLLGILITQGNRSNPRKSVAEYGWIVALPELSRTDSYFHVKYDPARRSTQASGEQAAGSNVGQAIFHRPANSGVYAIVANYELWRIGFNDVAWNYSITNEADRTKRAKALLQSVLYTFLQPNGAQRNTQNPHIVDFEGVISLSYKPVPAPTVSPVNDAYREQIKGIKVALEPVNGADTVDVQEFNSLQAFAEKLTGLIPNLTPFSVNTAG